MRLEELQSVRDGERRSDRLQELRESFYQDAGEYIQQLRAERKRIAERADDPFDEPEVNQLSDEIDTAESTVEAIYEKRVGKIVKDASLAAADMPSNADEMTREERELFETLVASIKQNRRRVFDVIEGTDETDGAGGIDSTDGTLSEDSSGDQRREQTDRAASATDSMSVADLMSEGRESTDEEPEQPSPAPSGGDRNAERDAPADKGDPSTPTGRASEPTGDRIDGDQPVRNDGGTTTVDRRTVRITADIEPFVGFDDREYDLAAEDIVSLPATNVGPLVERGVADPLD